MKKTRIIDFEKFFIHSTDLLYVTDVNDNYIKVNPIFNKTLGWNSSDLEGKPFIDIVHPDEREEVSAELRQIKKNKDEIAFKHRIKDKRRRVYRRFEGHMFFSASQKVTYGLMKDITEYELMQQQLQASILNDDLTGLYNKQGFLIFGENYINLVPRQRKILALMRLEIDRINEIEVSLGTPAVDAAFASLAKILKKVFRKSDIISRIGPNKFCILGMVNHEKEISNLEKRINLSLKTFNQKKTYSFTLAVIINTAFAKPKDRISLGELLQKTNS